MISPVKAFRQKNLVRTRKGLIFRTDLPSGVSAMCTGRGYMQNLGERRSSVVLADLLRACLWRRHGRRCSRRLAPGSARRRTVCGISSGSTTSATGATGTIGATSTSSTAYRGPGASPPHTASTTTATASAICAWTGTRTQARFAAVANSSRALPCRGACVESCGRVLPQVGSPSLW